jgi:hypothetical protein
MQSLYPQSSVNQAHDSVDPSYKMSNQVDHAVFQTSKFMVESVVFISTHAGFAIAVVLLLIALIFTRSKAR